tara:strand:+ start:2419 stop:3033 length:615 start_codon:yes stop_codon:yes gene_type:complete
MKFNNYTTIHGRVVKAYELPVKEIDDLNKVYEKEKKSLASHSKILAGRLKSELEFSEFLPKTKIYPSIVECMNDYMNCLIAYKLVDPQSSGQLAVSSCWINDMKEGEYNPPHTHFNSVGYSTVLFLKVPELLNDIEEDPHKFKDGKLAFTCIDGQGCQWVEPAVGNFFIFEAKHQHQVMPFKVKKKGETRRSMSFNFHLKENKK